jgi:cardiolipin synthase A/B
MKMRRRHVWLVGAGGAVLLGVGLAVSYSSSVPPHESLPRLAIEDRSFADTMEAQTSSPVIGGNAVHVLLNGDEIFPAKLAAIRSARSSILYAEYFYADGAPARDIAEALAERCRAGVVAKVLLDGVGTLSMPDAYSSLMQGAGCDVVTFRPLRRIGFGRRNHRNHRRILVIDGRIGLTGGSGVSEKWEGNGRTEHHWRDTDVWIEGPALRWLQAAFVENWREATSDVLGGDRLFPALASAGDQRVEIVRSSPVTGSYSMYTMYLLAIAGSRRTVYLTNPYFLPDERMEEALLAAVSRGVRVVALTPGKIDHNLVRAASRRRFGTLLRAGVEVYEYQAALLHSKTMVVDGVWATVGSTNFDNRSFALNEELNVVLHDRAAAARLTNAFQEDLARSRRVTYEAWKRRGLAAQLFEIFVAPIASQL